jgi:hypothetical protein
MRINSPLAGIRVLSETAEIEDENQPVILAAGGD